MLRYLISFDDGWMKISDEELPAVDAATRAVVREAKAAGVWVFGGGILGQQAGIVAPDGTVSNGPWPETKPVIGGFSIIEVASRDDAMQWAAKLASSCRCAQEVREIMFDPES
ncbi:YciI family protein [Lysobacter auxotrophicus]|uniref:YciI family protein n=2 Tax=Lysobacter auxotrophicus TaxID=2992573 RepID=A0ABM8DED1_9GAMM|nr:YciI family protein [Lysobacter auxotrophicus]